MSHWESLDTYPAIRPSTPHSIIKSRRRVWKWICAAMALAVVAGVIAGAWA
jgi:hypothetical protein